MITSKNNECIKRIASLKEKKGRREQGAYLVEGIKQVREALAGGLPVEQVVLSERYAGDPLPVPPEKQLLVSEAVFAKLSEEASPQGVLAVLRVPACTPRPPKGNSLLLDGIADPGNLGTIIRTANGAGYEDIYLKNCTDPFSPKCVRASMSGIFFVQLHAGGEQELFEALEGVPLICADMAGTDMELFSPPPQFCLVIGNEANGVSEAVRARCAHTVSVPLRETCESLNAAVAAGILMYRLLKK